MKKLGILFLSALFVAAMYVPVSAADWGLYGSARVNTFWGDLSEEITGGDSVTELDHDLQGNARIGANVSAGNISGRFEYGTAALTDVDLGTGELTAEGANVRILYGAVKLGGGQLLAGKFYSPWSFAGIGVSTQVTTAGADDANMLHSLAYNGRNPMLQYSINNLKVALVKPDEIYDGEVMLPRFEVYYGVSLGGVGLGFSGAYQTYDLDSAAGSGEGDSLDAYGIAAKASFKQLDPAYFNIGGFYGINPTNFSEYLLVLGLADISGGTNDVEDTSVWGLTGVVGAALDNGIRLEAGLGYTTSENDNWAEDDEAMVYYGQANIPLVEGGNAFIVPEVGYIDYKDGIAGADEGDITYYGLKTQINF